MTEQHHNTVMNSSNNAVMNSSDTLTNKMTSPTFDTLSFSDYRFLQGRMPNDDECNALGIHPSYKEWVREVDTVSETDNGGAKLFHYLMPNDNVDEKTDIMENVKQVRGIILNANNEIVCRSMPWTPEYTTSVLNKDGLNNQCTNTQVVRSIEGTVIRLFSMNDTWYISTHRKVDAYSSFLSNNENMSFGILFDEVCDKNNISLDAFTKFDKNLVLNFVMIHPKNRIVLEVPKNMYVMMLVNVYDKSENRYYKLDEIRALQEKINNEWNTNGNIQTNQEYEYDIFDPENKEQFEKDLNENTGPLNSGVLIISYEKDTIKEMIKICSDTYIEMKDLRGNNPSVGHRFLELRRHPDKQLKLEQFFNDELYHEQVKTFKLKYERLVTRIHSLYKNYFINNTKYELPKEEYVTIRRIHAWYKEQKSNNIQKPIVSREVVETILNDTPFHCLLRLLKRTYI